MPVSFLRIFYIFWYSLYSSATSMALFFLLWFFVSSIWFRSFFYSSFLSTVPFFILSSAVLLPLLIYPSLPILPLFSCITSAYRKSSVTSLLFRSSDLWLYSSLLFPCHAYRPCSGARPVISVHPETAASGCPPHGLPPPRSYFMVSPFRFCTPSCGPEQNFTKKHRGHSRTPGWL